MNPFTTIFGWGEEAADARTYKELPENAKTYLKRLEKALGFNIIDEQIEELKANVNNINYEVAEQREREVGMMS